MIFCFYLVKIVFWDEENYIYLFHTCCMILKLKFTFTNKMWYQNANYFTIWYYVCNCSAFKKCNVYAGVFHNFLFASSPSKDLFIVSHFTCVIENAKLLTCALLIFCTNVDYHFNHQLSIKGAMLIILHLLFNS